MRTPTTSRLYGLDHDVTRPFGQQLLAARRLAERGVRFIQVFHGDGAAGAWDAHTQLRANHSALCAQVDRPIAGLLVDLKRRGLLDDTIVVWATEFGRTPCAEGSDGRDHHNYGFSVWMAGGGIQGGIVHGATDELGFHAVEDRHYVTDIHATILHLLGLDSRRLEIPGRKRLEVEHGRTDPADPGLEPRSAVWMSLSRTRRPGDRSISIQGRTTMLRRWLVLCACAALRCPECPRPVPRSRRVPRCG